MGSPDEVLNNFKLRDLGKEYYGSIKNGMGPNPNGPRSVSCDRAIRYSGLGVRSVAPVEDFLEWIIDGCCFGKG